MKKVVQAVFVGLLALSGCSREPLLTRCFSGQVLISNCCTGSTFIALDGFPLIGKPFTHAGKVYLNVIQLPGTHNGGNVYLRLRTYNPDTDSSLFPPVKCYCLVAVGTDVPIYVATAFSHTGCPDPGLFQPD